MFAFKISRSLARFIFRLVQAVAKAVSVSTTTVATSYFLSRCITSMFKPQACALRPTRDKTVLVAVQC